MTFSIIVPDSLVDTLDHRDFIQFQHFLQHQTNRYVVGNLRYGSPSRRKKYMTRLSMELAVYDREGNYEQLLNIAVYCHLESAQPENKKFHFDPTAASATREKMDGRAAK